MLTKMSQKIKRFRNFQANCTTMMHHLSITSYVIVFYVCSEESISMQTDFCMHCTYWYKLSQTKDYHCENYGTTNYYFIKKVQQNSPNIRSFSSALFNSKSCCSFSMVYGMFSIIASCLCCSGVRWLMLSSSYC